MIISVTYHAKRDLMGIAKSIDLGQPAHGRNFSLLADFLCIKSKFFLAKYSGDGSHHIPRL